MLGQGKELSYTKHQFSLNFGGNYNHISGVKYMSAKRCDDADKNYNGDPHDRVCPDYVGFTIKDNFSFHGGFFYEYHISNSIVLTSGLQIFNHKTILNGNVDSIASYRAKNNWQTFYFPVEKKTSLLNVEIPLFVGFNTDNFTFSIGANVNIVSFDSYVWKFSDGTISKGSSVLPPVFGLREYFSFRDVFNTVSNFDNLKGYNTIYPIAKVSYSFSLLNSIPTVYFGLGFRTLFSYDIQLGTAIPFLKIPKKNTI